MWTMSGFTKMNTHDRSCFHNKWKIDFSFCFVFNWKWAGSGSRHQITQHSGDERNRGDNVRPALAKQWVLDQPGLSGVTPAQEIQNKIK